MKLKKFFCLALACAMAVSCLWVNAGAAETRATERYDITIAAKTIVQASSSFPLEVGEVVTIKASYSPFSASVDAGLIAPDGLFYPINFTDGIIDAAIEVNQHGRYYLAFRNNSSSTISLSGYVNY